MKKLKLYFLSIFLLTCLSSINAQKIKGSLELGNKIHSEININGMHQYNILLKEGEFALINLEQKGMDVKIVICDSDGKEIEDFDSPNGSFGNELILIDAHKSGSYLLKVISLAENKNEKKGTYTLELLSINNNISSHLDAGFKLIGKENYLPGFFVSIVNEKTTLYSNGKGFANIKKQTPYTVNTIQQIESISKTFLGISLIILVEQGKLDLDKDINTYLPFHVINPYYSKTPITLRHLATHTASINDREKHEKLSWIENKEVFLQNKDNYIYDERRVFYEEIMGNNEISMEAFIKSYFIPKEKNYSNKNFLKNKPGKKWYYSNIGATLTAYIIQLVGKQPYDEFVIENIIKPLKLENTTWGYNSEMSSINALKYGGGKNEYPRIKSPTYPDGGIYSSTADLSKYLIELIKGYKGKSKLLKENSFKEIMSVQFKETKGEFKGIKNGLFWWIFKENRMGHNGGNMGSNSNMFFYPDLALGYTSIENMSYGESDEAMIQSIQIKKILTRYLKYFKNQPTY